MRLGVAAQGGVSTTRMQVECGPGICISFHTGWWDIAANSWGKSRIWDTAAGVGGFEEGSLRSTIVIQWEWTGAGGGGAALAK